MAAYAALASLSQTTHFTIDKRKSLFSVDVEEKIRSIHEYVTVLLSFLEDFPEKAKRWEGKMRDAAREAEHIIEQLMWHQSYSSRMNLSSLDFVGQLADLMHNFCSMAGDIMDEQPVHPIVSTSSSRVAASAKVAVVGLEDDLMAMKDRICGMSSTLQIIPIVGMGGVGKTTLARNLYDDSLIMRHFDILVWLTISQGYSEQVMISDLLGSMKLLVDKSSSEDMKLKVYQHLKGRRYLIVMDDVWSTKVWNDVRNIFPNDSNGSRVMLTTRLLDLASYLDSNSTPHKMRLLNDSQCWDLLKRKVFAKSNFPPELEDVGKKIARCCVGLPLAVVVVAGVLSTINRTQSSWEELLENVKSVVGEEVEAILSLSYMNLPHHLRSYFLYIGLYPEYKRMHASTLIRLWVAEGFLKHQNGCNKSLEEEAEEYLEDLVKRNLVIVTKWKSNGKIKCFSLHDMVREMCIRKAHDEKFSCVVDYGVVPEGMINERCISFIYPDLDKVRGPTIRTILCLYFNSLAFLESIRLVRVLDAGVVKSLELRSKVFELFHLRYLAFNTSSNIPSSISNLTHLQTLVILTTDHQLQKRVLQMKKHRDEIVTDHLSLPSEIWRMPQLRHLVFSRPYTVSDPPQGSTLPLENLQTLWGVANLICSERILKMIPNIKKLRIVYSMNEDYSLHNLVHMCKLQVLEVSRFIKDSSWQRQNPRFPCTLKKLSLYGTLLPWKDMAVVGALPNLEVLKLRDFACDGDTWETNDGEFLQLKFLLIEFSYIRHWITETSHFPRLQSLVLHNCYSLSRIPENVGDIPTLELIEVDVWNTSLVDSAKQIQQDQLENYGNDTLQVRCIYHDQEAERALFSTSGFFEDDFFDNPRFDYPYKVKSVHKQSSQQHKISREEQSLIMIHEPLQGSLLLIPRHVASQLV